MQNSPVSATKNNIFTECYNKKTHAIDWTILLEKLNNEEDSDEALDLAQDSSKDLVNESLTINHESQDSGKVDSDKQIDTMHLLALVIDETLPRSKKEQEIIELMPKHVLGMIKDAKDNEEALKNFANIAQKMLSSFIGGSAGTLVNAKEKKEKASAPASVPTGKKNELPNPYKIASENKITKPNPQDAFATISDDPIANAFSPKSSAHAFGSFKVISPNDTKKLLKLLPDTPRMGNGCVYINVPFCQTRCSYCMFYITAYRKEESKRYADALIKELNLWRDSNLYTSAPIRAVYFGGGTPTALEASDLERIIKEVKSVLPLTNDCEITIEGRLSYFEDEKFEACLEGGANRFSFGVQTFDTEIRKRIGRLSGKEELIARLEKLSSYERAVIVIDLIYGLPNQTFNSYKEDLDIVSNLPIDGVDLYQLILLGGSPLARACKDKNIQVPDSTMRAKLYEFGANYLTKEHNFKALSVSHFSKSTLERNIYNRMAKGAYDTLAFGPGAGGKVSGASFMQVRNYKEWLKCIDENKKPITDIFIPAPYWRLFKDLGEMFELGFVDWDKLKAKYSIDVKELSKVILAQWQEAGLLTNNDRYSTLTLAGRFWAVTMITLLTTYLEGYLKNM